MALCMGDASAPGKVSRIALQGSPVCLRADQTRGKDQAAHRAEIWDQDINRGDPPENLIKVC